MRAFTLSLCLVLAACATPREACLTAASRDLAAVERLIAEVEANLSRGFAYTREPYTAATVQICAGKVNPHLTLTGLHYCAGTETRYRQVPAAIDPAAERRKLAELKRSRERLSRRTTEAQAACRARYPES